jgi:hypothetical protein
MLARAQTCFELLSPARHSQRCFSFNYFDRLVLKNVVDKSNRRAVAGDPFSFMLRLAVFGSATILAIYHEVVQERASFSPSKSATIFSSAPKIFKPP